MLSGYGRRFNFDHRLRPRQTCHTEERACILTPFLGQAIDEHVKVLKTCIDIRGVDVQTHDVGYGEPRRSQQRLEVVQRSVDLRAHIPGVRWFAVRVNGELTEQ